MGARRVAGLWTPKRHEPWFEYGRRVGCTGDFIPSASGPSIPTIELAHRTSPGWQTSFAGTAGVTPGRLRRSCAPDSLLELLRRRGRIRAEDLARLDLAEPIDLHSLKREWLDAVEPFVESRPSDEIGCLYYSPSQQRFVDPRKASDAVPHFGRPGGVLLRIFD